MSGLTPDLLAAAGRALTGSDDGWRRPLAELLGQFHPEGPRESVDPRRMSRWASGQREIEEWVGPALLTLLGGQAAVAQRHLDELQAVEAVLLEAVPE